MKKVNVDREVDHVVVELKPFGVVRFPISHNSRPDNLGETFYSSNRPEITATHFDCENVATAQRDRRER